jgi:hypothetical protein
MRFNRRTIMMRSTPLWLLTALLIPAGAFAHAYAAGDLSGHWEGMVQAPEMTIDVQIDVARAPDGSYVGTISMPGERLTGLPLSKIVQEGTAVSFSARSDQTFAGTLSADAQSIAGEFTMKGGSAPFRLTRAGEARIQPRPTSPKISERLAGKWNATIQTRQGGVQIVLTLANRADGRATGSLVNVNDGGLELPLAIEETADGVALRTTPVDSSFTGTLNADGTVLDGTFRQGAQSIALTFRRETK